MLLFKLILIRICLKIFWNNNYLWHNFVLWYINSRTESLNVTLAKKDLILLGSVKTQLHQIYIMIMYIYIYYWPIYIDDVPIYVDEWPMADFKHTHLYSWMLLRMAQINFFFKFNIILFAYIVFLYESIFFKPTVQCSKILSKKSVDKMDFKRMIK